MYGEMLTECNTIRLRRASPSLLIIKHNSTIRPSLQTLEETAIEYEFEPNSCISGITSVLDFIHRFYVPSIILFGLMGNLLSFIVFRKTHLKMRSSSYYLAALAMTDLAFLLTLVFVWVNNHLGWNVFNEFGWCQCLVYISAVCSSLSVWLIVAFTVERFIAVQYPLHRPQMCTISRARLIVLSLMVLAMICHSYVFVTAGVVQGQNPTEMFCDLRPGYLHAMTIINTIDSVISMMIPMFLIIVMNTMIMRNLMLFNRRFNRAPSIVNAIIDSCPRIRSDINVNPLPSHSSSSGYDNGILRALPKPLSMKAFNSSRSSHSHHSSIEMAPHALTIATRTMTPAPLATSSFIPRHVAYPIPEIGTRCIHIRSSSKSLPSNRVHQNITKMLLLISTVFVFFNLPSYIVRMCIFYLGLANKSRPVLLWCLQQFFMILYYTNFSMNFLLYSMCGVTFRRCLKQLSRQCWTSITRYLGKQRRASETS